MPGAFVLAITSPPPRLRLENVDVTFGEDVSGVGGKAGLRVAW